MKISEWIEYTGEFLGMNLKEFDVALEAPLEAIGLRGIEMMQNNMTHKDYTGKTRKSVMWRTKANFYPKNIDKMIKMPSSPKEVDIGSAEPNAVYEEYGTAAHITNFMSDEFVKEVTTWAHAKGIPDDAIYPIIRHIREEGTQGHPYAKQTELELINYAKTACMNAAIEFIVTRNRRQGGGAPKYNSEVSE